MSLDLLSNVSHQATIKTITVIPVLFVAKIFAQKDFCRKTFNDTFTTKFSKMHKNRKIEEILYLEISKKLKTSNSWGKVQLFANFIFGNNVFAYFSLESLGICTKFCYIIHHVKPNTMTEQQEIFYVCKDICKKWFIWFLNPLLYWHICN